MSIEKELLRIEEQLWTEGPEAYRRHVDEECLVAVTQMAGVNSREEIAASVSGGPRWREPAMELRGVVRPTDDVVLITYEGSAVRGDGEHEDEESYRALVSSGYVRRPNGWKLAFHQQTPLLAGSAD